MKPKPFRIYAHKFVRGYERNFKIGQRYMECPDTTGQCYAGLIFLRFLGKFFVLTFPYSWMH